MTRRPTRRVFTIERQIAERRQLLAGANGRDDSPPRQVGPPQPGPSQLSDESATMILQAIQDLDAKISALPRLEDIERRLQYDVAAIQRRIQTTKEEIAAIRHPKSENTKIQRASMQLDAIVEQTEQATSSILEAGEKLEELIGEIRDKHGEDEFILEKADEAVDVVTSIYVASNFQDLTGQRIRKVVDTLKFIEDRLGAMVETWGESAFEDVPIPEHDGDAMDDDVAMDGPQLDGEAAISQDDIDALFA